MATYLIEGPAVLYYGAANCNATAYDASGKTLLGITESGITISSQLMTHRISTDEYGGPEGPPAEILTLGGQASIQGTLVKWSSTGFNAMQAGLKGMPPGRAPFPGHGVYGGKYAWAFWVVGSKCAYYFPKCELASQPKEWNISALERRMNINIIAYAVNIFGSTGRPHIYYKDTSDSDINQLFPAC